MYIVILEWDGEKPPNKFYRRLHNLELFVRGDKELSPLKRRATAEGSVIAQEGAILCASESLANYIAATAIELGASLVKIGIVEPQDYHATVHDAAVIERIERIFGRTGRPSGEKVDWAITCYEECASYPVKDEYAASHCPFCSSVNFHARLGEVDRWKVPSGDIIEAWLRTRFVHGDFEVPDKGDRFPPQLKDIKIENPLEKAFTELIADNDDLVRELGMLSRESALRVLDAILAARVHRNMETRLQARISACTYMFQHNVDPTAVNMHETPNKVDFLDAAATLGGTTTAQLWMSIHKEAIQ